jgi:hypothetical protein
MSTGIDAVASACKAVGRVLELGNSHSQHARAIYTGGWTDDQSGEEVG